MSDIRFYAQRKDKWVRRKVLKSPLISELYDTVNAFDEKYKIKHWAIPSDINPEDYPELLDMEKIVSKHLTHYRNDFYLHDIHAYLKGGRKGIWMLRDTGTHYIPLSNNFDPNSIEWYKASINANNYFYLVDQGKIMKISVQKIHLILQEKMSAAA